MPQLRGERSAYSCAAMPHTRAPLAITGGSKHCAGATTRRSSPLKPVSSAIAARVIAERQFRENQREAAISAIFGAAFLGHFQLVEARDAFALAGRLRA